MVEINTFEKVSVIIPAYNEGNRIGKVIQAAQRAEFTGEVIVVNDGSIDSTSESVVSNKAYLVELKYNSGKSNALILGAKLSSYNTLLFLDADLTNLEPQHIDSLIRPVMQKECDTTIGVFKGGRFITDITQSITPFLNSQRVIDKQTFLSMVNSLQNKGYAIELLIYRMVRSMSLKEKQIFLKGVSQVMKVEKLGLWKGTISHLKMYLEIIKAIARK